MSSDSDDDQDFPEAEDCASVQLDTPARIARQREIAALEDEIIKSVRKPAEPVFDDAALAPPTEHDALSHLMGCIGWLGFASAAAVCRAWRDASQAKLQEWAVLRHEKVTGSAGPNPGQFSRANAVLDAGSHGVVIVDAGNRRLQILPALGRPCRVLDAFVHPAAVDQESAPPPKRDKEGKLDPAVQHAEKLLGALGRVPVPARVAGLVTADGGASVLIGLSREGHVLREGVCGRVTRAKPSGQVLRVRTADGALLGASASDPAILHEPAGLALAGSRLLVSDASDHCVHMLDASTLGVAQGMTRGEACMIGALGEPAGLAVCEESHDIFVCERANDRIGVFAVDGEWQRNLGAAGRDEERRVRSGRPGTFAEPLDVAVRYRRLFVAEGRGRRLQVLTTQGAPLQVLRLPGERPVRSLCLANGGGPNGFGQACRLWATADQSGLHLLSVGAAALHPP